MAKKFWGTNSEHKISQDSLYYYPFFKLSINFWTFKSTTNSFLYDIRLAKPAIEIHPFSVTGIHISDTLKSVYDTDDIALYKQSWALVAPNLIADARFGIFTRMELKAENAKDFIEDKVS